MLTMIIPTMNRSDFLIRLLNYYANTNYKHWIIIGDSSDARHIEKTINAIKGLKGKLKIIHREYPGLSNIECAQQMTQLISTPYAVFIADDDFLVSNGLEQSVAFLEKHQGYIAAHGVATRFSLQSSGPYGQFAGSSNYRLPSVEADTASQRILNYLDNYSVTLFCVHRTKCWRTMFKDAASLTDKSFGGELLPCCLSVIQGKVKQLDCLYLLRQDHTGRYLLPNVGDWINSPNWEPSYKVFCDRLAEELVRQDDITFNEAKSIVEQGFRSYLDKFHGNYARIKATAKYIPGMKYALRVAKSVWQNRLGEFSLSMLLNPSSPYHRDFMPVYRAVTRPPEL